MDSTLFQVEYNEQGKKDIILENISKMMFNRKIYDNKEEILDSFMKNFDDDATYFKNGDVKIAVKFLLRKITTIRKVEDIENFLEKFKDYHKIFIVTKLAPKAYKQFLEYEKTDVFSDNDLMVNIIDNILVPKHIVLTEEEVEQFKKEFGVKKKEMGKILSTDPMARYYGMKAGDIVKIERPSITSGISIYYRICVAAKPI
jgi:DNA-directed RNA polymerase subunit H (RpoH/RPB5)